MAYGRTPPDDRARMLEAIGVGSVDELFDDIPAARPGAGLDLPAAEPELELTARLAEPGRPQPGRPGQLPGRRRLPPLTCPPVVDQILLRGEFYTAYTPYQPEISQGTLQTIYEYQSLLAELTGLDVVSASHYDGATATAEAALMTCRATRRERVLVSRAAFIRHYRQTLETYFAGATSPVDEIPLVADGPAAGTTDLAALERAARRRRPARRPASSSASPTSSACSSRWPRSAGSPTRRARCSSPSVEPVSLAVLAPPGEYGADIAAGEGQPLGIPLQYGGPYLGILACRDALVRQIPGRLVGMTSDVDGRRAFVMTLRAREQDIRREKAASNICTNQALCALAAAVYLAALGPHGLRDVAALGAARAGELEAALADAGRAAPPPGRRTSTSSPSACPDAQAVHRRLLDRGILAGLPLARAGARRPVARRRPAGLRHRSARRPRRSSCSPGRSATSWAPHPARRRAAGGEATR